MRRLKQVFATVSDSGKHVSMSRKNKKLLLALSATLFLVAATVAIVAGASSHKRSSHDNVQSFSSHAIVKSSCSSTRYPELCFSAIADAPAAAKVNLTSQKDVIEISLKLTSEAVEHNYFGIKKILKTNGSLTPREKTALHDCLETIDDTLDDLHKIEEDLHEYPNKKSLYQHADDLKTLISTAITNQITCLDGFSHDGADKHIREALEKGEVHVEKMCCNALAMIKNMTDSDIANYEVKLATSGRNLREMENHGDDIQWPEWLSAGDRRILQSSAVKPNVVVAADGSGNFRTVSAAVAAAPEKSSGRYIIRIKAGVYRENVEVPKKKTNIMFMGDGRTNTIITGSRNVVDGSTTFHSATVAVVGQGFLARDIAFQNTAGHSKHQAVALRVGADC